jgi:Glycine-zipper domain
MREPMAKTSPSRAGAIASAAAVLVLAGCVSMPTGPSVLVMPGSGKTFEQFRADDFDCRQFASYQVNGATPDQSGVSSGVKTAAVGAAVGAAAGALMGGHRGAGTGAGVGLIAGSVSGAGAAQGTARNTQRQYDYAYEQCMYAKGHKVPVSGYGMQRQYHEQPAAVPPPPPPPPPQR